MAETVYYGRIVGNGTDIVFWDNGKVGNYWGNYNGQGAYVIDENNVDHFPLIPQVDISTQAPTPTPLETTIFPTLTIAFTVLVLIIVISLVLYRRHRRTACLSK
ncbi:hypothetical protein IMZ68_05135 [Candidatus Bathyarchaeota archaeon]|nr:hypothetical protein [Candidatus Bathyarchaeota archaeon]